MLSCGRQDDEAFRTHYQELLDSGRGQARGVRLLSLRVVHDTSAPELLHRSRFTYSHSYEENGSYDGVWGVIIKMLPYFFFFGSSSLYSIL